METDYAKKLKSFCESASVDAEVIFFDGSCHSAAEAAETVGVDITDIVKSIGMIAPDGRFIVAIVKGEDRASTSRVAKALQIGRPRIAEPDEVLEKAGYPVGGTPPVGYEAVFLVDSRVMEKDIVYAGGGSTRSILRIAPGEIIKSNNGTIARVRK
ncbi:MAG: aminoacyl-tRNA deacylase [Nanoarchaeota archaeon]